MATHEKNPEGGRVGWQFARYAVPSVIGMVVSSLYTVVDGIFVGRGVGEMALGAVNIAYPFIMLQIALVMLIAIGGANRYAITRGRSEVSRADGLFGQSVVLLLCIALTVNVAALCCSEQVGRLLGADETLLPDVQEYIRWMALFGILYMPGLGISIFVRNDGAPGREMLGTLCGALTNIALDYLFIMRFGWGIGGAAVATGIGQMVSVAVYMTHFFSPACTLRLRLAKLVWPDVRAMLYNGVASFLMEFSQSAIALSYNWVLMRRTGAAGVAAYSVVMYVCSIFNMVLIGVVQGAQPLLSTGYGRGDADSARLVYRLGIRTNLALTALFYAIIWWGGKGITGLFIAEDEALLEMASGMMRLYFLGFFPIGVSLMNILCCQTSERERRAILVSLLRCIGFLQAFLIVLPALLGKQGIYLSLLCAELCNMGISLWMVRQPGAVRTERRLSVWQAKV